MRLVFFTQDELEWVHNAAPGALVVTARAADLGEVAAHMLGADVLVTGGSSLASALAAFAESPNQPVVLEAMTKESSWGCHHRGCPGRAHVLPRDQALRLDRSGRLGDGGAEEVRRRLAPRLTGDVCRVGR